MNQEQVRRLNRLNISGVSAENINQLRVKTKSNSVAYRLHDFWRWLVITGEEQTKVEFTRTTFSRNMQALKEAGIDWVNAEKRADILLASGDESVYRANDERRYVVECLGGLASAEYGGIPYRQHRKRKFSNPLFLAPCGLLNAYPENDEDLFISLDSAQQAIKKFLHDKDAVWSTSSTTLKQQLKTKPYLRWVKEVKPLNGEFKEVRRTLDEKAEIYRNAGLDGLKARYTNSHAFHTMAQLKLVGLK